MNSLNEVISAGKPQKTGVEYFICYPAEFIALIKRDFVLACAYADVKSGGGFTKQEVLDLFKAAKEKRINLFEEMTKVLRGTAFQYQGISVKSIPLLNVNKSNVNALIIEMADSIYSRYEVVGPSSLFGEGSRNCHRYSYNHYRLFSTYDKGTASEINGMKFDYWGNDIAAAYKDFKTRQHVLAQLPNLIHNLMEALDPSFMLDQEFNTWMIDNPSLKLLVAGFYYQLIADLLSHLSPQMALKELAKPKEKPDILHTLLDSLPNSLVAVKEAIERMKALKPEEFKTFIRSRTQDDLLEILRNKEPKESNLVQDFCKIAPSFLKDHFRTSGLGLEFPSDLIVPPVQLPPPYSASSSSTGAVFTALRNGANYSAFDRAVAPPADDLAADKPDEQKESCSIM